MNCTSPLTQFTDECHGYYGTMAEKLGYGIPVRSDGFPLGIPYSYGQMVWANRSRTEDMHLPNDYCWEHFLLLAKMGVIYRYLSEQNHARPCEGNPKELWAYLTEHMDRFGEIVQQLCQASEEDFTAQVRDLFDICWYQYSQTSWTLWDTTDESEMELAVTPQERLIAELKVAASLGYCFCDRKPTQVNESVRMKARLEAKRSRARG